MYQALRAVVLACIMGASLMPAAAASAQAVSLQLVNLDHDAQVRIVLDGVQVFDGVGAGTPSTVSSKVIGRYELDGAKPHTLIAECPASRAKTRLDWTPSGTEAGWVVVTYYPGRGTPTEPAFFTVSLQKNQTLVK